MFCLLPNKTKFTSLVNILIKYPIYDLDQDKCARVVLTASVAVNPIYQNIYYKGISSLSLSLSRHSITSIFFKISFSHSLSLSLAWRTRLVYLLQWASLSISFTNKEEEGDIFEVDISKKMGKKEQKDHHSTVESDDKVEAVLHLLRKHSPLTLKQVCLLINYLTDLSINLSAFFFEVLVFYILGLINIAGEVL